MILSSLSNSNILQNSAKVCSDGSSTSSETCNNLMNDGDMESVTSESHRNRRTTQIKTMVSTGCLRLNKFVRRLHDMLVAEKDRGVVEWRKGLLVLHSTDAFATKILPKYFNTKNFKTFRRQLNYYGFVHVRSFSTTGQATTALWVNQDLAKRSGGDSASISSVLLLKRVDPSPEAKTAEGRRVRKEEAAHTVECDIGIDTKAIQMDQLKFIANKTEFKPSLKMSLDQSDELSRPMSIQPVIHASRDQNEVEKPTLIEKTSTSSASRLLSPPNPPSITHELSRSTSLLQLYKSEPNDVAKLLLNLSHPKRTMIKQ